MISSIGDKIRTAGDQSYAAHRDMTIGIAKVDGITSDGPGSLLSNFRNILDRIYFSADPITAIGLKKFGLTKITAS